MTDAVTVYRWDDVGAPSLASRKPSDIMKVVKACLVDGYGTKSPLGWSVEEDEINTAAPHLAVRNNMVLGGSGGVTSFSAVNDSAGTNSRVQSHQEYTSKTVFAKSSYYYDVRIRGGSSAPWVIIGTAKAFWFIKPYNVSTNYWSRSDEYSWIFFCGDMYSFIPNDPNTFIQIGRRGNGSNTSYSVEMPYTLTQGTPTDILVTYPINNENDKLSSSLISPMGNGGFAVSSAHANVSPTVTMLADMFIIFGNSIQGSVSSYNDPTRPRLRGRVPGLKISDVSGWRNEAFPVIKPIHTQTYFQMPDGYSDTSCVWIGLETWE